MQRRRFLQSSAAVLSASVLSSTAAASESDTSQPVIPSGELQANSWTAMDSQPSLPDFVDADHRENVELTQWDLNAFHGEKIHREVEKATPFTDVRPLSHIWTATVTPAEGEEFELWRKGESAESLTDIDDTTEEAYERYMENQVLNGELEYVGEWHRKAVKEGAGLLAGKLPFGDLFAILMSWKWELQGSLTTHSGVSASISEYYFGLPLTAISPDAEQHVENETTVDFRGLYIDWFAQDGVFKAAGAVYPEDRENLTSQIEKGLDDTIIPFDTPEFDIDTREEYEPEMIELLSEFR